MIATIKVSGLNNYFEPINFTVCRMDVICIGSKTVQTEKKICIRNYLESVRKL